MHQAAAVFHAQLLFQKNIMGQLFIGFSQLFIASLILGLYYKLIWAKRAYAVYWLLGTLLYPWMDVDGIRKLHFDWKAEVWRYLTLNCEEFCDLQSQAAPSGWEDEMRKLALYILE